ncbi:YitT family protein [Brevibacillus sp. DP1.3A]|uniref:YczE/YyaS/YitT family protein n=1 Tax=Brevibacillus sp. DP1.3A TaxID=2738867 RepID=UPI00156A777D|nr:YitT family protein [Brevibacillus sp. DP1.3A]UED74302.1 YitT family protein [Brevibacillus sp. DP1.3A]
MIRLKFEYLLFIAGLLILALGINMMTTITSFGLSPYDSLFIALYQNFGISIGFWMFAINLTFVVIVLFMDRSYITVGAILVMVLISIFVDLIGSIDALMAAIRSLPPLLTMALGNICIGSGIGLYVCTQVCTAPQEAFVLVMSKRLKWTFRRTEILLACMFLSASFLLDGPIYYGTVVLSFTTGYIIQAAINVGNKMLRLANQTKGAEA